MLAGEDKPTALARIRTEVSAKRVPNVATVPQEHKRAVPTRAEMRRNLSPLDFYILSLESVLVEQDLSGFARSIHLSKILLPLLEQLHPFRYNQHARVLFEHDTYRTDRRTNRFLPQSFLVVHKARKFFATSFRIHL